MPNRSSAGASASGVVSAGVAIGVEEQQRELHGPDAVGERVVQLHDQRGASAIEVLHQRELPEGVGAVERGHGRVAGERDHRVGGVRRGRVDPPEVPGEVEPVVDRPPRRGEASGRLEDTVAQHRDEPGRPVDVRDEHIPVGARLQPGDRDDRRSKDRIPLHVPGESVGVSHEDAHRPPLGGRSGPVTLSVPPRCPIGRGQGHRAARKEGGQVFRLWKDGTIGALMRTRARARGPR